MLQKCDFKALTKNTLNHPQTWPSLVNHDGKFRSETGWNRKKKKLFINRKACPSQVDTIFCLTYGRTGSPAKRWNYFQSISLNPPVGGKGKRTGYQVKSFLCVFSSWKWNGAKNAKRLPKCNPNQGGHKSCWHIERKLEIGKVVAVGKLLLMDWDWQKIMLREKRNRESYFFCC